MAKVYLYSQKIYLHLIYVQSFQATHCGGFSCVIHEAKNRLHFQRGEARLNSFHLLKISAKVIQNYLGIA